MDPRVHKLISEWTPISKKEFKDYRKRNYALYFDNVRIKAQLKVLAQRKEM